MRHHELAFIQDAKRVWSIPPKEKVGKEREEAFIFTDKNTSIAKIVRELSTY